MGEVISQYDERYDFGRGWATGGDRIIPGSGAREISWDPVYYRRIDSSQRLNVGHIATGPQEVDGSDNLPEIKVEDESKELFPDPMALEQ